MKIFALVALSGFLAAALARPCSKTQGCPKNWKCVITSDDGSKGNCKYNTNHGGIDYNRANRAFTQADVDHNKKITYGGAYRALHGLVPSAPEALLDKLTKKGDKNKDGSISYSEFIAMYRVLVDRTKNQHNPNDKCHNNPCGAGNMCRTCKNTKGYCCHTVHTVPKHTDHPTGSLNKEERAQVNNIFTALNTNKDKGVSRKEFYQLLLAVRQTMGKNTKLYGEVYNYVMAHGDTNHDGILDYSEFLKACTTLKAKDPKNFPLFLKSLSKLKPLKLGDACAMYGVAKKPCPKGSSCQRTRVQVEYKSKQKGADGKTRRYTSYRYFCTAATTTKKPVLNIKAGKQCTYGYCKSGCRKCAKGLTCRRKSFHYGAQSSSAGVCTPSNCKACTTAKGIWMGNKCQFGNPGIADGVMYTNPKQCAHADAARKARCYQHHDCRSCISKSHNKQLGTLCGWSSGWGGNGSCQPNNGGGMMVMATSTKKCPKEVVVHGRE